MQPAKKVPRLILSTVLRRLEQELEQDLPSLASGDRIPQHVRRRFLLLLLLKNSSLPLEGQFCSSQLLNHTVNSCPTSIRKKKKKEKTPKFLGTLLSHGPSFSVRKVEQKYHKNILLSRS